jgi:hypothetical protein
MGSITLRCFWLWNLDRPLTKDFSRSNFLQFDLVNFSCFFPFGLYNLAFLFGFGSWICSEEDFHCGLSLPFLVYTSLDFGLTVFGLGTVAKEFFGRASLFLDVTYLVLALPFCQLFSFATFFFGRASFFLSLSLCRDIPFRLGIIWPLVAGARTWDSFSSAFLVDLTFSLMIIPSREQFPFRHSIFVHFLSAGGLGSFA